MMFSIWLPLIIWGFPVISEVMNLPAMQETQETQVVSLGWDNPLEEEMATHSSTLAWEIPWTEEPRRLYSPWSHKELGMTYRLSNNNVLMYIYACMWM